MGCDIHTKAETRFIHEGEEHWSAVTAHIFPSPYYRPERPLGEYNEPYTDEPYKGRNYRLFGFLADVRNGRGFAGIDTGESVQPILGFDHPTRGVPDNASEDWKNYVKDWGQDLHSTSWLTLRELKAADWDTRTVERGIISAHDYEEIRASQFEAKPDSWSGFIQGPGIQVITADEYEAIRDEKGFTGPESHPDPHLGERPVGERYFIRWQWEASVRSYASDFIESTFANLELVAPRIGDLDRETSDAVYRGETQDPRPIDEDGVRLVFGFDN